jgi:hypothetical protein
MTFLDSNLALIIRKCKLNKDKFEDSLQTSNYYTNSIQYSSVTGKQN